MRQIWKMLKAKDIEPLGERDYPILSATVHASPWGTRFYGRALPGDPDRLHLSLAPVYDPAAAFSAGLVLQGTYPWPVHAFLESCAVSIGRTDVLTVLAPIWSTRPETARRVRQRMRTVFRWAMANELIETNPAGEAIDGALPSMPKIKAHLRALPYQEVSSALKTVDASQTSLAAKRCLRFLVLTAAPSGEARGATWDEIDLDGAAWTIPASRMKAGLEHRVPLSDQILEVLTLAHQLEDGSGLCFPSPLRPGRMLSDMTLTKVLRSTGLADRATVHGFRTSFKTWTMEQTDTPWAVGEAALAHLLGGSVEQAYARSDLFVRRRTLMQQWADYIVA